MSKDVQSGKMDEVVSFIGPNSVSERDKLSHYTEDRTQVSEGWPC